MKEFSNKDFWNNRYKTDIKLGSGRGSRGDHLKLKEKTLNSLLKQYDIRDVLDIGCGDCEVNKNIDIPNYTGLDVSDYVIDRNKKLYPDRTFIVGGFGYVNENKLKADAVVCMDVLIHQPTLEDYNLGVQAIKNSFKEVALISAFQKFKTIGVVYFYESIIESFSEYHVEVVAQFDIQTLVKVTRLE